ncbi:MarR family transcriptional regulator [Haloferax profundi]|uniref:Uncharacterized protein n=1 Tax=Haloferax profundi TaxID=1544718 RepID=A0A0W1SQ31_9EURY|nr:helix-turn-helix domain-containing protein [Haloferax profundi]KTG28408.1 hypothetical protein AUR66_11940 [Haloferax profundi]
MRTEATKLETDVLAVLERHGPLHVTDLAARVGTHPVRVEACCSHLVAAGEISTTSCGVYDR